MGDDLELDPLDADVAAAMFAVSVEGVPATDAWLAFVRTRYPAAADVLARLALTDMALELLVERRHVSAADATRQGRQALNDAARELPPRVWREISQVRQRLQMLERYLPGVRDVVVVDDATELEELETRRYGT